MTLFGYLSRNYLMWFSAMLLGILAIIFVFDSIELLRRTADKPDATLNIVLIMALLNLPDLAQKIMPFVALFAAMLTLYRLARSQELAVIRAIGVSVWEFLLPILVTTVALSLCYLFILNPLGALMKKAYKDMENKYIERNLMMEFSSSGLWLRQSVGKEKYLLHADTVRAKPFTLKPILAFIFDDQNNYKGRIDGEKAELVDGKWIISNAWVNKIHQTPEKTEQTILPTELSSDTIQESMSPPATVSFWDLPGFITALESTGFSGTRHKLYLFSLAIQPVFLSAMVLIAACFSLGMVRRGGGMAYALAGLFSGGFAFAFNDMILTLGISQTLPTWLAAFAAPLIALSAGATVLFYLEDG